MLQHYKANIDCLFGANVLQPPSYESPTTDSSTLLLVDEKMLPWQLCFLPFFSLPLSRSRHYSTQSQQYNKYIPIVGAFGFRFISHPVQLGWAVESATCKTKRNKVLLLSGATGCIGRQIWLDLMQHTNHKVKLIVRKESLSKLDGDIWKQYSHRSEIIMVYVRFCWFLYLHNTHVL